MSASALPLPRTYRDLSQAELVADGAVHAAALIAGVIGFSVLFQRVALRGAVADGIAMGVYAAGFFLLFGFSCAYNMAPASRAKAILRRFDHASIYLMIGGTYTALLSQARASFFLVGLAALVWAAVLTGATGKILLPHAFERFGVKVYLALGWSVLLVVKPLASSLPEETLALVIAGGALYSIGVPFHLWERLKFQTAIWHAWVAAGAACQFAGILEAVGR